MTKRQGTKRTRKGQPAPEVAEQSEVSAGERDPSVREAAGAERAPAGEGGHPAAAAASAASPDEDGPREPPATRAPAARKPSKPRAPRAAAKRAAPEPSDTASHPAASTTERAAAPAAEKPSAVAANRSSPHPSQAATVAPPSRGRARGESGGAEQVVTINGVAMHGEAPQDEEIWTDGTGAGTEGQAGRALRADVEGSEAAARLVRGSGGDRLREAAAFGSSQSLLSTDYYFRQYGAHGMRSLSTEVDEFGFDPHVDAKARPLLEALCKRYFRVELVGAENLPESGRALLVANRSGALPWDGLVLRTALRAARPNLCPLRWLAEDSVIHYPFMGVMMNRLGAVRACPENAERLLSKDRLVAVFPEGAQGSRKLFRDRYRLQRFGRGGYVKLALKFEVPILPTAIIGAEETNPVLGRSRLLGRLIGADSVPITPTFPWLGLAGLLPAPVKWRIVVGEPIDLSKYGSRSADDALVVHRLNEQIRASLQALVDQGKTARGRALFG